MRFTAALISLLSLAGCKPRSSAPEVSGVSVKLAYPVLLIGQSSVDVRDSEQALISITGASSLNLNERSVLDSQGRLYKVKRAAPVGGQGSPMWSMGTKSRLYYVEVAEQARPSWVQIQGLVLEQIPRAPVREFRDLRELIEASRASWNWTH
jgi:hypothetical protein